MLRDLFYQLGFQCWNLIEMNSNILKPSLPYSHFVFTLSVTTPTTTRTTTTQSTTKKTTTPTSTTKVTTKENICSSGKISDKYFSA